MGLIKKRAWGSIHHGPIEERQKKPVYLVVNKIDAIHPDDLLPMIEQYRHELDFKGVYPISALEGNNVPEMLKELEQILPEGPQYYPEDQLTDHPEYFVVGELIREKNS